MTISTHSNLSHTTPPSVASSSRKSSKQTVLNHPHCHPKYPAFSSYIDIDPMYLGIERIEGFDKMVTESQDLRYTPVTIRQHELVWHENMQEEYRTEIGVTPENPKWHVRTGHIASSKSCSTRRVKFKFFIRRSCFHLNSGRSFFVLHC
jgi:hypothetical protein